MSRIARRVVIHRLMLLGLSIVAVFTSEVRAQETAGRRYAVLVGVREYDRNQLRNLPYPENDVTELADLLKQSGFRRVELLTQTEGAKRSRALPLAKTIRETLAGVLEDRTKDDLVLVAFAGHGVQFKGEREHYFCPMDAVLTDKSTLVSLTDLYKQLEQSKAGTKLLIVDACRNDPLAGNARDGGDAKLESVTRPQLPDPPGGVAALFSCSAGQKAFEDESLKHGIFFHHVILGLKGEARLKKRDEVTWDSLITYVKLEVPDTVKDLFGNMTRQIPESKGELRGSATLVLFNRQTTQLTADEIVRRKQTAVTILKSVAQAINSEPIDDARALMAWNYAQLGNEPEVATRIGGVIQHQDAKQVAEVGRRDECERAARTLGVLKARKPEANVSGFLNDLTQKNPEYADAIREWFLSGDRFLPMNQIDPVRLRRELELGLADLKTAGFYGTQPFFKHAAGTVELLKSDLDLRRRIQAIYRDQSLENLGSTERFVLASFCDDIKTMQSLPVDKYQMTHAYWAVLPFIHRRDFEGLKAMLDTAPEKFSNGFHRSVHACLDEGYRREAEEIYVRYPHWHTGQAGGACTVGTRWPGGITTLSVDLSVICGPWSTYGRLGRVEEVRQQIDKLSTDTSMGSRVRRSAWMQFVEGLLRDCFPE